jgi:hypothetical protein
MTESEKKNWLERYVEFILKYPDYTITAPSLLVSLALFFFLLYRTLG